MTLKTFVRKHRKEISEYIKAAVPNFRLNDDEREMWVMNDEYLYNWARREGVK